MARSAVTPGQLQKISMDVGVVGVDQILKNIDARLTRMSGMEAKKVWMRAALAIVREIRDNIHSVSGKLSSAIFAAYGKAEKPNVIVGVSIGGRGKAPHGWVVEFGHGGPHPAPSHPYFKPGVLAARPVAAAILAEGMRDLATK